MPAIFHSCSGMEVPMTELSRCPVKIKICGMAREADALHAAHAGADFLGYIFHPSSPRNVDPATAAAIIARVRAEFPAVRHVGVFVNQPPEELVRIAGSCGLDFAQLQGAPASRGRDTVVAAGHGAVHVLRIGPGAPEIDLANYPQDDYLLVDTFDTRAAGGTGRLFDRSLLPPGLPLNRCFFAGGLNPGNVAAVLASVTPFAVDVSSGVEESPGRKSHELVEAFIHTVRSIG